MRALSNESGFSLVELLIALSILSLVVATLTVTFGFAQGVFEQMGDAAYRLNDITLTRRLLGDALSQLESNRPDETTVFAGNKTGFTMSAIGPRILSTTGPMILKVEILPGGGLAMSWEGSAGDERNGAVRRVLASDYAIRLTYYSVATGWTEIWSDAEHAPSLLRIGFAEKERADRELALTLTVRRLRPVLCAMSAAVKGCMS
jgi:prepilin-type N-terminal cleavage/methylation domain-containing protein